MCMIAYAPKGSGSLTLETIYTAAGRHPDGFGLMWRDVSGPKPMLKVASYAPTERPAFMAKLDAVQGLGVEFAAHFRWATSGPKNADMAHPYTYEDPDPAVGTVAVMHNGVIGIQHDRTVESDTSAFVRLILANMPTRWWANPALVYLVREAIGYSKLTIMTATETAIVGEEKGDWDDGIWYSSDHKPSKWVPAVKGGHEVGRKAGQTPPDPRSKRSQKRAAKRGKGLSTVTSADVGVGVANIGGSLVPYATPEDAYVADTDPRLPMLVHAGHIVDALVDMPLDIDGDYQAAVICTQCRTTGDVYVIDGSRYMDLAHFGEGDEPEAVGAFAQTLAN